MASMLATISILIVNGRAISYWKEGPILGEPGIFSSILGSGLIAICIRDELGGPPKIFGVLCPPQEGFYCTFINKFSKIYKNLEFYVRRFFSKILPKFPENFLKFSQLFQNRKNYYYCTQNSPKSLYLSKFGQIFP